MSDDFLEEDDDGLIESKSARKRQMHALQNLGEQLVDLSAAQLAKLNIDNEALIEAVQLAQRISHRSGRRRQMQFIGKLMRRRMRSRLRMRSMPFTKHRGRQRHRARYRGC